MTRPYSLDLRLRAVSLVEAGQSRRAVARLLDLGEATVIRWMRRHAATGGCAAKPMGGVRHAVLLHERDWLLARVAAVSDLTVRALRAELAVRGTRVVPRRRVALPGRRAAHLQKKPAGRRARGNTERLPLEPA